MQLIDEGKTNTAVVNHYSLVDLGLSEAQVGAFVNRNGFDCRAVQSLLRRLEPCINERCE